MTFHHYPETDSLYIDLSEKTSTTSHEVLPGIDVDHASENLGGLETYLLSESALAKDWLRPEEDEAWQDL